MLFLRSWSSHGFLVTCVVGALSASACSEKVPTYPTTSVYGEQPPATFRVDDGPCVAGATGAVSCRFVATSPGILAPIPANGPAQIDGSYTYNWRFTNPENGRGVEVNGPAWRPPMDCTFAPDDAFLVAVRLTVYRAFDYYTTGYGAVRVTRPPGSCGK